MCGITGIYKFDSKPVDLRLLNKMASVISHRGPDDEGYLALSSRTGESSVYGGADTPARVYGSPLKYCPDSPVTEAAVGGYNLGFGFRRLSIIDLSPAGHQPMCNDSGDMWIMCNGEVYNYVEIREELLSRGYRFVSASDTEVILKAYEEWGTGCLSRFNGMWAFCIWDGRKKELFCARDRLGVKPFYYYLKNGTFIFSSEIKSILAAGVAAKEDDSLLYDFFIYGLVDHTERTFFKGIHKLPQSHYLVIKENGDINISRYWDFDVSDDILGDHTDEYYASEFKRIFYDAVNIRLRSDVPIGSCLSGGLDSSTIVVVANDLLFSGDKSDASRHQKTFSACYAEARYDERIYIEEVIRATSAERNYVFPAASGFRDGVDSLIWHQEEPFGSSSIYAQWCVLNRSRKRGVLVLLDGQGGDEQLGGYSKFYLLYLVNLMRRKQYSEMLLQSIRYLGSPQIIGNLILNIHAGGLARYFSRKNRIFGIDTLLRESFRRSNGSEGINLTSTRNMGRRIKDDIFKWSLPGLLRYEDKNSMAHAVEARLPFLDYRLVEFLASCPLNQKMRDGWTKYVMRSAMKDVLPEKIRLRKSKLGFTTPESSWLKNELDEHVRTVLNEAEFIREYAHCDNLVKEFDLYRHGLSSYQTSVFFRFYITEMWARKFILNSRSAASL